MVDFGHIFTDNSRRFHDASEYSARGMEKNGNENFFNYLRMSPDIFHLLLGLLETELEKQPRTRLEITLCYLASGEGMTSISYLFRVGIPRVSEIIHETCLLRHLEHIHR
ncbi:unnamed protein product [Phaedon cochleariae]|uniref:Uncharacterized protein n=1 Tax=Phaedon cochleariae TaxID=80249 RepID=A0A9N9SIW3_PHACE|nr:unnamed protein product [Phaedon cochleariae]